MLHHWALGLGLRDSGLGFGCREKALRNVRMDLFTSSNREDFPKWPKQQPQKSKSALVVLIYASGLPGRYCSYAFGPEVAITLAKPLGGEGGF